ncbi:MAG: ABC transporter permease [Lachnospiraceae bacterium]|nr:ABC transporter permease [Lachnospiraceae bacterium]
MNQLFHLTKRNILVYIKDKSAVFFSMLSMMIVLMLMFFFLGDMNVNYVTELQELYGGARDSATDLKNADMLVQYWTLAGLMVVNSMTVTLTVVGTLVTDRVGNKLKSFYTAPVSRLTVALSYILSAIIVGFVLCTLVFVLYMGFIWCMGGEVLTLPTIGKVLVGTLVNVILFSVLMYLLALFVKSSSAWGGLATIVGTFVGFLGAVYIPVGSLPEGVTGVLKCLPILHAASIMRKFMCMDALEQAFAGVPEEVVKVYREVMGIDIVMQDTVLSTEVQLLFLAGCGIIVLIAIALAGRKHSSLE